jgi:hypothetical protein
MVSVRPTPQTFPADFSKPSPTKFKIAVWWWIHMHIKCHMNDGKHLVCDTWLW